MSIRFLRWLAAFLARRRWWFMSTMVASFAGPPTDRAHLLLDPQEGDACEFFSAQKTYPQDCQTDGHYLCCECGRRADDAQPLEDL